MEWNKYERGKDLYINVDDLESSVLNLLLERLCGFVFSTAVGFNRHLFGGLAHFDLSELPYPPQNQGVECEDSRPDSDFQLRINVRLIQRLRLELGFDVLLLFEVLALRIEWGPDDVQALLREQVDRQV